MLADDVELVVPQHQAAVLALLAQLADVREGLFVIVIEAAMRAWTAALGVDADLELPVADGQRADDVNRGLEEVRGPVLQSGREAEPAQRAVDIGQQRIRESEGIGVR